jgi:hypothetical protein
MTSTTVSLRDDDVVSLATTTRFAAKDAQLGSHAVVLSHVAKNQDIIRASLGAEFNFTADVLGARPSDGVYLAPDVIWGARTFCVVDHADVKTWITRAYKASLTDSVQCVVCLCPARTNADYFHEIILPHATSVRFIRGRLKMPGHSKQSPYPSCIVIFGTYHAAPPALGTIFARPEAAAKQGARAAGKNNQI